MHKKVKLNIWTANTQDLSIIKMKVNRVVLSHIHNSLLGNISDFFWTGSAARLKLHRDHSWDGSRGRDPLQNRPPVVPWETWKTDLSSKWNFGRFQTSHYILSQISVVSCLSDSGLARCEVSGSVFTFPFTTNQYFTQLQDRILYASLVWMNMLNVNKHI